MKFKTNINCEGCIEKVTPYLNQIGDGTWTVDTINPEKILTVEGPQIEETKVIGLVRTAGFNIERIAE